MKPATTKQTDVKQQAKPAPARMSYFGNNITLEPVMSEKAYNLSEQLNTYVFKVPANANKQTVAGSVAYQYQVKVRGVRLTKTAAKSKRLVTRRGRNVYRGQSTKVHKAYVTLEPDNQLPIFAALKEQEQKAAATSKAETKTKKAETPTDTKVVAETKQKKAADEKQSKPRRQFWRSK
ncbi:50S ribosomal protein L23 [Candidatus Saccharibacteria bacterium RIFCSPLOWO2_01_FULL_48_13]|nr:MAG: 50S ribosomal protein L23 [Candidatus Saccharibacteria bacterium RIFCSPHIGHO2_01_FULL_48_12]OGL35337.1 MAG: 50S ribosomal protein L23 [Candidatus Saccharibacteria bacterium RIFCSPHIGHO2_12_FULL_48_21]OGL37571.1 MAG: 50S ribosomal protein L23 [Candidatus Saccharibacteria bacterium RIFCSPLOWO2_01_FULL_48_13]